MLWQSSLRSALRYRGTNPSSVVAGRSICLVQRRLWGLSSTSRFVSTATIVRGQKTMMHTVFCALLQQSHRFVHASAAFSTANRPSPPVDNKDEDVFDDAAPFFLKLCYTEHDIEEGDIVSAPSFDWNSIMATTEEAFGCSTDDDGSLEYYNGEDWLQWKPFRSYDVLLYYAGTKQAPLPVRIPALYDDEYGTRHEMLKVKKVTTDMRKRQQELLKLGPSPHQWLLKETIDALQQRLKRDGYQISEHSTLPRPLLTLDFHNTAGQLETVDQRTRSVILEMARAAPWVRPPPEAPPPAPTTPQEQLQMQRAAAEGKDPDAVLQHLKFVLLSHPRALRHIEECLHYEFMWSM